MAAGVAGLALAAPAAAHVQVTPTAVAPGDPVRFEVLVPNERGEATTEVAVQVPEGLLPFSWEETPGWERTLEKRADGSIDVVRWRGRLPAEEFVSFSFLAGTPEQPGELRWASTQAYGDDVVRWIGGPDSEFPAAVTVVSEDAARQNAGGEGAGAEAEATPVPEGTEGTYASVATEDGGRDGLTLGLAIGGLVLGATGLALGLRR